MFRPLVRRAAVLVPALLALSAAPASAAEVACDRYASPAGSNTAAGTLAAPFRTPQKLADSLTAGQTGCLRGGTYTETTSGYIVKFRTGGAAGAPVTLRSAPGERAVLKGVMEVKSGADFVTVSDLDIVGTDNDSDPSTMPVSVQIMAADTVFERNDVTNNRLKSCLIAGSNAGYGEAVRTVIRNNVFHECGDPAHGMLDHAIYFERTLDVEVYDNILRDNEAWAIHLYPNARRTRVHHNVIDGNGGGAIFAGSSAYASSDNVVERNVITNSRKDYNVSYYWKSAVGTGNVARANCLYNGYKGNMPSAPKGFTAQDNVAADPLYVDRAAKDFRLQAGSPCLALVGYDIAAKVLGQDAAVPAPLPEPTPEPTSAPAQEPASAPVNLAPSVDLLKPLAGATFTDRLTLSAAASDDGGVSRVDFLVDGVVVATDSAAPYSYTWKAPKKMAYGEHTVSARARDAHGLTAISAATVKRVRSTSRARVSSLKRCVRSARTARAAKRCRTARRAAKRR